MMKSRQSLIELAMMIRSEITPFVMDKGHITDQEVIGLLKGHGSNVASPRSIQIIQEELCNC